MNNKIAIVLTGTIVPNTTLVTHVDPISRRNDYLTALKYYSRFLHVYFLENSSYDLLNDNDFLELKNVTLFKAEPSEYFSKGKGFQEFQLLDLWLAHEVNLPDRWIKITGRYIYKNFPAILKDCLEDSNHNIIIDQDFRLNVAYTTIFCVKTRFYLSYIKDIYRFCDDAVLDYVEYILYNQLVRHEDQNKNFRFFKVEPQLIAKSGTSGVQIDYRKNLLGFHTKNVLRKINFILYPKYLVYSYPLKSIVWMKKFWRF